jgi:hypothetical protein
MIDGTYDLVIHAPIGRQELKCDLKTEGGALTGRTYKPGTAFDTPIYEGTAEGNSFRFKVDFPVKGMGSFTFTLTGEAGEDTLSGMAKMALGKCRFEAARV